jgi:FkbM family methyltransferase
MVKRPTRKAAKICRQARRKDGHKQGVVIGKGFYTSYTPSFEYTELFYNPASPYLQWSSRTSGLRIAVLCVETVCRKTQALSVFNFFLKKYDFEVEGYDLIRKFLRLLWPSYKVSYANLVQFCRNFGLKSGVKFLLTDFMKNDISVRVNGVDFTSSWDRFAFSHLALSWSKLKKIVDSFNTDREEDCVFFDVGANMGGVSFLMAMKYPNMKIYAFEPSDKCFSYLERNLSQFENVEIIKKAVSSSNGDCVFYEAGDLLQVSSINKEAVHPSENLTKCTVSCTSIDCFIAERDLRRKQYLLKIDVQGAEKDVIEGLSNNLDAVSALVIESSWLDVGSIEIGLFLVKQFDELSILNDVTYGADLLLTKMYDK